MMYEHSHPTALGHLSAAILPSSREPGNEELRETQSQKGKSWIGSLSYQSILMDGDWEEVGHMLQQHGPQSIPIPTTTLAFDTSQELLWTGNQSGRVSAFYNGTEILQRYTSHKSGDSNVRQIIFHDKGVISLCPNSVHMAMRRGPPIWHITHVKMEELTCMSYTSRGTSEILVAGSKETMFTIDVDKGTITKEIPAKEPYEKMKRSRSYICAATANGSVNLLDPLTFNVVRDWKAHQSKVNSMDAQHDYIVTCGYNLRQGQSWMLDPLVNVFDLKNMVQLPPVPFPAGAAHVRMHPRMSTTIIITSQNGQMHIVDLMNPNTSNVKQANCLSAITMIEIAPSGEAMALADSEYVHLWGSPSRALRFAEISNQLEFPHAEEPAPQLDWTVDTPLSSVGMPYYRETLLSAWPSHMIHEVGAPPPKIDAQVLAAMRTSEGVVYGPNSRTNLRRNQVENTRVLEKSNNTFIAPKFLSEKARDAAIVATIENQSNDLADALGLLSLRKEIPSAYQNLEIKYSKYGVEDFDFGFFNSTRHSGLEIHIPNCYANSLLQILHFTPLIRNLALKHTATACMNDLCLLCELGFLFDMLETDPGHTPPCQATNFLRTFSNYPQVGQLGLLEDNNNPSSVMLQGLTRFLMDRIIIDWKIMAPQNPEAEENLTTSSTTSIRCSHCRNEHSRASPTYVTELLYPPPKLVVRNARSPRLSFSQILKNSVERETTSRGWCSRCQRYQQLATRKAIHSIPAVFMLNAAINNSTEAKQFWATPGWLPEEIGIIIDQGQFFCYQGEDLKLHVQRGIHPITVYSLIGVAAEIGNELHKPHLVSLVNVAPSSPFPTTESQWHLFNDFAVTPTKTADALTFNMTWKTPCVITYQKKVENNIIKDNWKQNLDTSLLYIDTNMNAGERSYRPLVPPAEIPKQGTIIALDTEFVELQKSEIAVHADGRKEIIRPRVYGLGRVSVIRGSGDDEFVPFIDDYIAIKEYIIDYNTQFSGLVEGDLDPRVSRHNVVSLKLAYKRLWILQKLGCKFVGHGLQTDFRVCNIRVARAQTIDTARLFYIAEKKRKLSLSFLSWCLLNETIQQGTHDSIVDARIALKIYRKYLEFQDAGIFEAMLQDIFQKGEKTGFKNPEVRHEEHVVQRVGTPPITGHGRAGTGSGPTTPVRRPVGLAPGSASTFTGSSGWTPGKGSGLGGSPLR